MSSIKKAIVCLYTGIIAANATEIIFNGEKSIPNHEYLGFNLICDDNTVMIHQILIDEEKLRKSCYPKNISGSIFEPVVLGGWKQNNCNDDKYSLEAKKITLVIPGEVKGKQTYIGQLAFEFSLNSECLRLKLQFMEKNGKRVKFPQNCFCMFCACTSITEIDFRGADTSNVTIMTSMFAECTNLKTLKLNNFNTSNVTDMSYMFCKCKNLENLDMNKLDMRKAEYKDNMFKGTKYER